MTTKPTAKRTALPGLTESDLAIAERVATFLLPVFREAMGKQRGTRDDETATFCREYTMRQRICAAMPASAGPMARVELQIEMLDLASAFVAQHDKVA